MVYSVSISWRLRMKNRAIIKQLESKLPDPNEGHIVTPTISAQDSPTYIENYHTLTMATTPEIDPDQVGLHAINPPSLESIISISKSQLKFF